MITQINDYETDFVRKEIFESHCYFKNGIRLESHATVFDIGANIGLFSMYVKKNHPDAQIYAVEPAPKAFECLSLNLSPYSETVTALHCGVSSQDGFAPFFFYPGYSVISGYHADPKLDEQVIRNGFEGMGVIINESVDQTIRERFSKMETIHSKTRSLSSLIREFQIQKIDLLKIDAEKSEISILKGIETQDWKKIQQLVLEVHHAHELAEVLGLLHHHGFQTVVEAEALLESSEIKNIYATRTHP